MRLVWFYFAFVLSGVTPAFAADRTRSQNEMKAGITALYRGNPHSARIKLMNAVQADPQWALPRAVQARVLLTLNDGAGADAELKRAMERGMPHVRLAHLMADAALLQGDTARALAEAGTGGMTVRSAGYAARVAARAHAATGNFSEAAAHFDRAIELIPASSALWSDIGRFRMTSGNVAGALDAAKRAIILNKNNHDAVLLMGELVRGQFGLVASIPWFERAITADPANISAMAELAATLGDAGRARAMLAVTRKMLLLDPGNAQAYFFQSVLAARAGNDDLARTLLYRTDNRLDRVPAVMLLSAVLDLKAGAAEQAIARLQDLVKIQPANLKAKRLLGAALWHAGDAQSAISILRPVANRPDADSYTLSVIGRAYEEQNDRATAATYLDRAAAPVRGDPVPFEMAATLVSLARETAGEDGNADIDIPRITRLIAAKQITEALAAAQALERRNPGAPAAHVLVGDALMAMQQPREAAVAYKTAANIHFSEPTALRFIDALRKSGQDGAALRVLDAFLGQNPRSISGLLLAADHFTTTGQWDKAIAILEGLRVRIGNRDAALLGNLGWAWLNKRNYKKAVRFAAAAYALAPGNPAITNGYGWILFQSGYDKNLGLSLLRKASAIAPHHPGLAWQAGQALAKSGMASAAKPYLVTAARAKDFPDRRAAAAMLATL